MAFLKNWVAVISVTAVVLGTVTLLAPSGRLEKLVRISCALCMLVTMMTPLVNGGFSETLRQLGSIVRRFDAGETSELSGENAVIANAVSETLSKELKDAGIDAKCVTAVITDEGGEYTLERITVTASDEKAEEFLVLHCGISRDKIETV